jgi:hypothetical protein
MVTNQQGKEVPIPLSVRWEVLGYTPEEEAKVTKNVQAVMGILAGLKIPDVVEHVAAAMRRDFPARDILVIGGSYLYEYRQEPAMSRKEFLALPIEERRRLLKEQVEALAENPGEKHEDPPRE